MIASAWLPGVFALNLVFILIYFGFIALILFYVVKFLISVPKEQKLLRMELGKLAEEVHQIRKELEADKKQQ